ncbi:MAG TPA: outer membrane protein transport protein [Thermoanaerobaculia bacterium]|jgi:long-chain fatty acid transport protein|nr:outer membrane protein transport protein [Thermoanaerobaculia bacterium]
MRQRRLVSLCLAAVLAAGLANTGRASAAGFGLFQHGGRALGQAGAFTARASEPSAIYYNPAAITQLEGFQVQAGLDFFNSEDKYQSATGSFSAKHIIEFPPALYATWSSKDGPWAVGIGLDAPFWYRLDWFPVNFPARFKTSLAEVRVAELHPVIAYDLGDGWSFGGGLRYVFGTLEQGNSLILTAIVPAAPGGPVVPIQLEGEFDSGADVDALAWDVAIHYADPSWGWGAVYRSNAELKGSGDVDFELRPIGHAAAEAQLEQRFGNGRARQAFEIPRELRGGVWFAPYPELRLEADASWQSWSSLEATAVTYSFPAATDSRVVLTPRDWDDTLSLRLGAEGNITDPLMIYGGIAWEPSPVSGRTVEPGFSRGDALVYAAGISYSLPNISFDLGYSFHDHDRQGASAQELLHPGVNGSYNSSSQVWGFSIRRRW